MLKYNTLLGLPGRRKRQVTWGMRDQVIFMAGGYKTVGNVFDLHSVVHAGKQMLHRAAHVV